uniref:Variant surface glycoprotein n=1 Tax=Trypanosoma brucei TaxID=5691 RepID=S5FXA9_9TRYP|nr:variant surface glycoprotein [Trypanosoma brucei]
MRNDMKRLTAVVLLLLGRHDRLQKANAAANAQAAEFNALCSILELANKGLTIGGVTTPPSIQTDIKFLTALNLSLAPDDFFNQNFKRTNSPTGESEEWTANKATWAELQENIKAGNRGSLDTIIHRIEGEQRRRAARQVVNATLIKVASLKQALKTTPSSEDIKQAMQLVLYGDKEATSATGPKTFGSTAGNGQKACGHDGSADQEAGISLASDFVCLCGAADSNGIKACAGFAASEAITHTGSTTPTSAFTDTVKYCHESGSKATPAAIQAAILNFRSLLGKKTETADGKRAVFGAYANNGACNGNASPNCVTYKARVQGKKLMIPWLVNLERAAELLSELNHNNAINRQISAQIASLAATAYGSYLQALHATPATYLTETATARQADSGSNSETKKKECDQHKNNKTACTEANCKWKGGDSEDKGECEADETKVTDQTNQASQDQAAGETTSKCTGIESKEKCEAVQGTPAPGKKSVCGWITYEDGKGTLDKPYCRDSSFLVNKQFALSVVSAAFMALLF